MLDIHKVKHDYQGNHLMYVTKVGMNRTVQGLGYGEVVPVLTHWLVPG